MTNTKKKKTVLVVTGSRADYGLLRPIMRAIEKSKKLRLKVLVTGMHTLPSYGNTQKFVRAEFPVAATVTTKESDSTSEALAKEIAGINRYCLKERPDLILILGDRDESFAAAIVGGHMGIPVAHIHGGDKTGPTTDEYIRHATTKFSHLHFPATELSARRVRLLGEEKWRVFATGAPGLDELRSIPLPTKKVVAKKYGLSTTIPWYVVAHHPTTFDPVPLKNQITPLFKVLETLPGEKIVAYPNADGGTEAFVKVIDSYHGKKGFHISPSMPRADLIAILKSATLLIGNSSMGIIDASFLKLPTVNVGNRQAMRERGANVIDCSYDEKSIRRAIAKADSAAFRKQVAKSKSPYGDGHAAEKIVRYIEQNIDRSDLFHKKLTYV